MSLTDFVLLANPTISSFSPSSGAPGTAVTINGTNLSGVNGVKFNGTSATFNFISDTQVMSSVPAGATTGKITVTTASGIATSGSNFTVTGGYGSDDQQLLPVERRGGHLGHHQRGPLHRREQRAVQRDVGELQRGERQPGHRDRPHRGDDRQDHRHHGIGDRDERLELHRHRRVGSDDQQLLPVERRGGHLGHHQREPLHRREERAVQRDVGELQRGERQPGHRDRPHRGDDRQDHRHTASGIATSGSNFTVTGGSAPTISNFSPSSGVVGTTVTINGNHFTGATSVRFNGTSASFSFANDDRLTASVPAGATTGRITVATASGTATSASNFTVTGGGSHDRSVVLSISGRYASGHVGVNDGYSACSSNVPVVIKRLHHGEWHWVTTTSTRSDGDYRALIGGKDGRYRAKAKKITLVNGTICEGQQSSTVHHR